MASAAPLGDVTVEVRAPLDRLLADFAAGKAASERFDQAMRRGLGGSMKTMEQSSNATGAASRRMASALDSTRASADRYGSSMRKAAEDTRRAEQQIKSSAASIRSTLMASASTIVAAFGAREIIQLADNYVSFTNRLRSAGLEGDNLAKKQEQLLAIANKYGVALGDLGQLYARVVQSQNALGASSTEIERTVEGAAAAVRLFGSSAAEQQGAIRQLSQLLGNPRVQMQEINSLLDGARPLLQAVASGIQRFGGDVSKLVSELRGGGFETKEFFRGLQEGLPKIIEDSQKLPLTLGASFQVFNNQLGTYIGQTDKAWSATQRIGAAIRSMGANLDTIMPILTAIVLAIGARYVGALGKATLATIRQAAVTATASLAQTTLANTSTRVTTTLGTTAIATGAYSGSLGVVTLTANAATAGLTRMQIVMATAGALAKGAGSALLAAFGGWVGVAIFAIVGAVILYNRRLAEARQEVIDFNTHHKTAVGLLREEQQRAAAAGREVKALGGSHQTATGYVAAFAGATGDAADALHRQAVEARNARVELIKKAAAESREDERKARARYEETKPVARRGMGGEMLVGGRSKENIDAEARMNKARQDAERLERSANTVAGSDLLGSLSPNVQTGGRDLRQEIIGLQTQLVAAQRAGNESAMRELNKQIKIRKRITELMQTGLSLEIASAQADAEHLGPATRGDRKAMITLQNPVAGGVSSGFGPRARPTAGASKFHPAIDFPVPVGTAVKAPAGGVIIRTGRNGGLGNVVWIDHGNGTISELNHLSSSTKSVGDVVAAGDTVALSGNTGTSTGPHLDWRVRTGASASGRGGRYVNVQKTRKVPGDMGDASANLADAEQDRTERDAAFERDLGAVQADILQATQTQSVSAQEIARIERTRIGIERDRHKVEIEAKVATGDYTEAQGASLLAANENLRKLQLAGVDLEERHRLEQEATRTRQQAHDAEIEILQAQQEMARTASQRRAIERRILEAQKEYERKLLQAIIDSPFTSPLDRQLAQGDLGSLDRRYGAKAGGIDKQTRDDLLGTAPEGSESAHRQQMDLIREQETERLAIVQEALDARIIKEEEAARRRVEIERDAQAQLRQAELNRQLVQVTAAQETADALTDITRMMFGEQSKAYRAMFIVSKAFAIAKAVMDIQVALASATASLPFPANLPAIATVAALGATIIGNIMGIAAQFDVGGWTGGQRGRPAGVVHGEEYVVRAPYAGQNRAMLDSINAGRDPTAGLRGSGVGGRMGVTVKNYAPGVAHEARQIGPGEVEIIARSVVQRDAPGVVAADVARPNSRMDKALRRTTTTRRKRG